MYKTLSGKEISISKKIAKGGEGEVYEILGDSDNCIKIYYERVRSQEKEEKLKYMVLNPPEDLQGITHKICWPKEVIYEEGKFVGFMMYKAFDDSLLPYHLCQPLIPKKLSNQWHTTFNRKTFKGRTSRLKLSVNIVAVVNRIHNNKRYIIVDLKPQNLLVTAFGKVSIIDMDSVQIVQNEKVLFKAPVSTPEYTPPEASDIIRSKIPITKDWDTFSLGILVYEILCGIHPYVGSVKPPFDNLNTIQEKIKKNLTHVTKGESAFSVLPPLQKIFYDYSDDLKNIFKRIFCPYKIGITVRPSLEEFGETLFNAVALLEEELKNKEQKRLGQEKIKKKLEEKEAIENYKKLKNDYDLTLSKLVVHKSDNTSLRKQLEETKNKSNVLVPILVICLLIFMGLFISTNSSNNKKSQENNLPLEQYEADIINSKSEIKKASVKAPAKGVEKKIVKKASVEISSIYFRSSKYGSNFNEFAVSKPSYYLTRGKCYYLYPTITYIGNKSGYYDISIKYIHNGGLLKSSNSTTSYSLVDKQVYFKEGLNTVELKGFGADSKYWWDFGDHTIEVWIKGKKSFSHVFKITPY
ncbi:hypothetical protein N8475_11630 [Winogradskyella sp.]|nr:hypothetical protein [Winogradskyella sp.]